MKFTTWLRFAWLRFVSLSVSFLQAAPFFVPFPRVSYHFLFTYKYSEAVGGHGRARELCREVIAAHCSDCCC